MKYQSKLDPAALLQSAKEQLSETGPDASNALVPALGTGLRRGKTDRLLWRQTDFDVGVIHVEATEAGGLKTRCDWIQQWFLFRGFRAKVSWLVRNRGRHGRNGIEALGSALPLWGRLLSSYALVAQEWSRGRQAHTHVA
jgi:hypothetical protein